MNSDELFWQMTLSLRTVDEAEVLWWLAACGAEERPYKEFPRGELKRIFGYSRSKIFRARARLEELQLVSTVVHRHRASEFTLDFSALRQFLLQSVGRISEAKLLHSGSGATALRPPAQSHPSPTDQPKPQDSREHGAASPGHLDPFTGEVFGLPTPTASCRLCILLRSREQAMLLIWLHQVGAHRTPVRLSTRALATALLGLIDRRTAMRAFDRLHAAGLVTLTPGDRTGTDYCLNAGALRDLLHQPFPFSSAAAKLTPGWVLLDMPLLHRPGFAEDASAADPTPAPAGSALEAA